MDTRTKRQGNIMEIREQATQRGRLKFEIVSKTAAVTGYSGQDASLVIPETVDGYPVVWLSLIHI